MLKALRTLPRSSQTYLINIHTSYSELASLSSLPQLIIDACPHLYVIMAEATGLEPVISASKAGVLPLHYTPI